MDEDRAIEVIGSTGDAADRDLLQHVRAYLAREEATNTIQLSRLHARDGFDPEVVVLVARAGAEIVAVATLEPPFHLLLSHVERDEAILALAEAAAQRGLTPPGVMGPPGAALTFAGAWSRRTGVEIHPGTALRIMMATSVVHPAGVAGRWRHTEAADDRLLLGWFTAFAIEALRQPRQEAARQAEAMLNGLGPGGGALLWLDAGNSPVSVACYKAPTPHGIRIGPVYTPPEHRRRGYGGAVTAAATGMLLDRGFDFVCLYTDSGNSTSNHVYETIGYRLVADSMQYRFGEGET